MSADLVTISYEFSSLKANLVRSRLESDGICCFLFGEALASVVGSPSSMGNEILIQVSSEDEARARHILQEVKNAPREEYDESQARIKPNFVLMALRILVVGGMIWYAVMSSMDMARSWIHYVFDVWCATGLI